MTVIYKISSICKPERCYIGSAMVFAKRRHKHLEDLRKGKHHNPKLQRHFNKYGESDLKFEVLEKIECSCALLRQEQYWMDKLEPYFNISKIAGSRQGLTNSKEHREKISKTQKTSMLGNKNGLGNQGWKGKKLSDEHRRKIKENHWRKKKRDEEAKVLLELN